MTMEEQLKDKILSKYKSVRSFTTAIGVPYSTLVSVFQRGILNAGVGTMVKVFSALDLNIESISTGTLEDREPEHSGDEEQDLTDLITLRYGQTALAALDMYAQLDRDDQGEIRGEMRHMLRDEKYQQEPTEEKIVS